MKHKVVLYILYLLVLLYVPLLVYSQDVLNIACNSLRVGDCLERYIIKTNSLWNLSQSEQSTELVIESYESYRENYITKMTNGYRTYYSYRNDTLFNVGHEAPLHKIEYNSPEIEVVFPLKLGDYYEGYFAGDGNYCSKVFLRKYGWFSTSADSLGTLVLRDGTELPHVLQIRHVRKYVLLPIYSAKEEYMDEDKIKTILQTSKDIIVEENIKLYATGYRYPLIENLSITACSGGDTVNQTYYYPPSEQECLPLDEVNMLRRRATFLENGKCEDLIPDKNDMFSYVYNDIDRRNLIFRFPDYLKQNNQATNFRCSFVLSDNKGIVYRVKTASGAIHNAEDLKISYSGLRSNQYILSIILGDDKYSSVFYIR